jgi:cation:H+ antiporter
VTVSAALAAFALGWLLVVIAGSRLAGVADRLADRTGWGEALTGAVLLGATTSLPGITVSVTTAWQGHPEMAVANAIGGIAAQTTFLGIADVGYRRANLEHAAASMPNLLNAALLTALLAGALVAASAPASAVWGVSPATPILLLAYVGGLRLAGYSRVHPQWHPRETSETRRDRPAPARGGDADLVSLFSQFLLLAAVTLGAGWLIARSGLELAAGFGLSESLIGALFTSISTSTPELITSVAAVRRGALTLAVGNIIGGNCFDVMFAVAADVAYREGSIYHAISWREEFLCELSVLMTAVLLLGLLYRQKKGPGNIGFESVLVLLLYIGGVCVIVAGG